MIKKQINRRAIRDNSHELMVLANRDGTLRTVCSCGEIVANRHEDRLKITLSDLLELVRLHQTELDDPKQYR